MVEIAWQSSVLKFQVLGVQNFGGLEISRLRIAYDFNEYTEILDKKRTCNAWAVHGQFVHVLLVVSEPIGRSVGL